MILAKGDKVHIITRRLFEKDLRRHFVGEVKDVTESSMMVKGHAFVFDTTKNQFERKPELRMRLFSLADNLLIINVIPRNVDIDKIEYCIKDGHLVATDGTSFTLNINEFGTAH